MEWLPILALPVLLVGWSVWTYRRLLASQAYVNDTWASAQNELAHRHALITRLVQVVGRYTTDQGSTLERTQRLLRLALQAQTPGRLGEIDTELDQQIRSLLQLENHYPDLRASQDFHDLGEKLGGENPLLQTTLETYNQAARHFNSLIDEFPNEWICRLLRIRAAELYRIEDAYRIVSLERLP